VGLVISGANLATLTDAVIPLANAASGPTAVAVLEVLGDFPYTFVFGSSASVPIWSCDAALPPTGQAIELDIRILLSGTYTSIYATRPSIGLSTNSSRGVSGGTFSSAFIAGTGGFTALTILQGASVRFQCTQFSTTGGGGLKVQLPGRRAS
jgi:hypothetical protein